MPMERKIITFSTQIHRALRTLFFLSLEVRNVFHCASVSLSSRFKTVNSFIRNENILESFMRICFFSSTFSLFAKSFAFLRLHFLSLEKRQLKQCVEKVPKQNDINIITSVEYSIAKPIHLTFFVAMIQMMLKNAYAIDKNKNNQT